jgi:hypothetical protein
VGIQTDLNQRERQRFAKSLRMISKAASKCADALEAEDDPTAMVQMILMAMGSHSIQDELLKVFTDAAKVHEATQEIDKK